MSIILETIIKSSKITDYLTSKNVQWNVHDGDRYKYRCPLPGHNKDNTPSFFVYEKPDRQDFYCYGCKNAGSIIQLVSAYEQISIRDAIKKLSKSLNIDVDDIIDSLLREIIVSINSEEKSDKTESIIASLLFISVHMHDFLEKVKFEKEELEIAENIFTLVDSLALIQNIDELEKLSNAIPDRTAIRYNMYVEKNKQEEIQNIKNLKSYEIKNGLF